jgi:hypothetical protein
MHKSFAAALVLLLAGTAGPAAAGQITIVNNGTREIGFQIFDGQTYVDSGRVRPPAGTSTSRTVPDKKITLVLWRGQGSGGGKYADKDRCQVDLAKGVGTITVSGGNTLACKVSKK